MYVCGDYMCKCMCACVWAWVTPVQFIHHREMKGTEGFESGQANRFCARFTPVTGPGTFANKSPNWQLKCNFPDPFSSLPWGSYEFSSQLYCLQFSPFPVSLRTRSFLEIKGFGPLDF